MLTRLPHEVLEIIINMLPIEGAVSLSAICKNMNSLAMKTSGATDCLWILDVSVCVVIDNPEIIGPSTRKQTNWFTGRKLQKMRLTK